VALAFLGLLFYPFLGEVVTDAKEKSFENWELVLEDPLSCDKSCNWTSLANVSRTSEFKNYRGFLGFRLSVPSELINELNAPAVFLGPIGDVDETYWNGVLIGKTGSFFPHGRFLPHVNRTYEIPKDNISKTSPNILLLRVQKIAGPGVGPYRFAPIIGEHGKLGSYGILRDFLRSTAVWAGGLILFVLGLYHLIIFNRLRYRKDYLYFGMSLVFFGIYAVCVSFKPYELTTNPGSIFRIHAISAYLTIGFFVAFVREHFERRGNFFDKINLVVSSLFVIASSITTDFDLGLTIFSFWFPYLLVACGWIVYVLWKRRLWQKGRSHGILRAGFLIFFAAITQDILVTLDLIRSDLITIYGMFAFLGGTAITLARDFAVAYSNVESQVAERTNDLATALDQLRALEKMKERFFANVSHDLKTPITVALGAIDELKKNAQQSVKKAVGLAENKLSQLLGMVNELLDTVKAESGTLKMNWARTRPAALLKDWLVSYDVLCRQKGIVLELMTSGHDALEVPMDTGRIRRVMDNILSNAVKFSDRRSGATNRIRVSLRTDEARLYIQVDDSGIGIPVNEREKIFDRFYQSSRTSLREHGGSGIGLASAKQIVELHNGKIRVEDSGFGGSRFIVSIPLSQDVEVVDPTTSEVLRKDGALRGSLDVAFPRERPELLKEGQPHILVAEDNPEVAQVIFSAFSDDFNIHFAPNGQQAFERVEKEHFDCLVLDFVMPVMRGDELVRKLRGLPKMQSVPIVMLSSHGDDETITELLRIGANDYVTKPFRREILVARVKAQIHAAQMAQWIAKNEKVIELGFLAGGMAHQIRNGLNSLQNQVTYQQQVASSLLDQVKSMPPEITANMKEKLGQSTEIIQRSMERIEKLVNSVHTYSSGSKQKASLDLGDVVQVALTLHADALTKQNVALETRDLNGIKFLGYTSFHEAVLNILTNAIEACKGDGSGKIVISAKDVGDHVELLIQDNGEGIAPETLSHLCQPFFTTKPPGKGTGLGLYVARDVVEAQHGGKLEVRSDGLYKGTTITIRVPKDAPVSISSPDVYVHGVQVS